MILLFNVISVLKYRNLNNVTCSLHNLNKKTSLELDSPCVLTQAVYEEYGYHRGQHCTRSRFLFICSTNPDVFSPKTFLIPRGIIPQFSSLGFAVSEELGNKQTNRLTDRLVL